MDIQGHRGARGLFPENTLEGFVAAAALGVTAFELDVGMTADGVVVAHHDLALNPDLTRDASGAWLDLPGPLIRRLTLDDLQRFDVGRLRPGSPTALLFPDQQANDGARIPTLAAVLAALPSARLTVEVKTDPARPADTVSPTVLTEAVLSVVDAARAAPRVIIESFDWRVPRHIRHMRPDIRLAWLTPPLPLFPAARDDVTGASVPASVAAEGGPVWAPNHLALARSHLREAHALGLSVLPWTVNKPEDMRRMIAWGVDGLITDRPDLALAILAQPIEQPD